jgi:hypothetical protein
MKAGDLVIFKEPPPHHPGVRYAWMYKAWAKDYPMIVIGGSRLNSDIICVWMEGIKLVYRTSVKVISEGDIL